jgi:hypothetical protein
VTLREVPKIVPAAELDRLLARAEQTIALIDRVTPVNLTDEIRRLSTLGDGEPGAEPGFQYRPRPELSGLLAALEVVAEGVDTEHDLGELYAERARELVLEARLVSNVGATTFSELARARFPLDRTAHGEAADVTARQWAALVPGSDERRIASDDPNDPESLLSTVQRLAGALRLPVRVVVSERLASAAATGDGVIVVRAHAMHRAASALRIAVHEIHGHAMPRHRARSERLGIFATGTVQGPDDEEGRALLIEERHGLLDAERRRELGVRHLIANAVRCGAEWTDALRIGTEHGLFRAEAVRLAARVVRGGGLAREIVYLPAWHRVRHALERRPSLEQWLERGRIAVHAVPVLERALSRGGVAVMSQENVATTGT